MSALSQGAALTNTERVFMLGYLASTLDERGRLDHDDWTEAAEAARQDKT